jgi:hypothetical protein
LSDTDIERMQIQAEALFVHDASGRLLRVNEPEPTSPAPRFFLGRTAAGNLWRTRFDLPDELSAELARLAADEPVSADLERPPTHEAEYRALLERHAPVTSIYAGPACWLPESQAVSGAVMITSENLALADVHFGWLRREGLENFTPVAAVVAEGTAAALCFSSRVAARVCEAGVYTVEAFRGRGYAAEAVRAWARGVRAYGKLPLYSTSWENRASQAVARRLGAVRYGADFSVT